MNKNAKKIESLKSFKLENKKNIEGGRSGVNVRGIRWIGPDFGFETASIGTYVDGFNMGTDGHED